MESTLSHAGRGWGQSELFAREKGSISVPLLYLKVL